MDQGLLVVKTLRDDHGLLNAHLQRCFHVAFLWRRGLRLSRHEGVVTRDVIERVEKDWW